MDLQARLDAVIAEHKIPGATLGVLHGDDVSRFAAGVLNRNTGVEATVDSLFQIGSITKVWTATLVMMLVEEGVLDLDEPVVTYLPDFKVADADVTARVTLRDLLSHRSGIGGDHILDTGRGDDVLERYVATCADIGQEHDLGATMSYCNTGFSIIGRVIEQVTGKTWDRVLRRRLIRPLGLTHTNTLAEEAILFRTAAGHVKVPGQEDEQVAPTWVLPRSAGPAGLINASAGDLLTFGRLHLDEGRAADGTQLLSPGSVKQMQEAQIDVPDPYTLGNQWGLGWILFSWDGHGGYGHDGSTIGQRAYLRVFPDARLAVCLLTNGGSSGSAFRALCREIAQDRAGVTMPPLPAAPATPPAIDLSRYEGTFGRLNVDAELRRDGDVLQGTIRQSGPLAEALPEEGRVQKIRIVPVDREVFLVSMPDLTEPMPMVFFDFDGDTPQRFHFGARAMARR
jgi:CubicO group peptidase (beta-lactamase class C family)